MLMRMDVSNPLPSRLFSCPTMLIRAHEANLLRSFRSRTARRCSYWTWVQFFPAIPSRGGKIVLTPRKLRALQGKYLITYPLCPIFGYPSYGLMDRLCWWVSCARSKDTDSPRRVEKSECKAFGIKSWVGIGPPKKGGSKKAKTKTKTKAAGQRRRQRHPSHPPFPPRPVI